MIDSFRLEGNPRKDGLVRFTCDDLPGFRLLLKEQKELSAYNQDITDALSVFLPLYKAAETRNRAIAIEYREGPKNGTREQSFEVVASLAPC